MIKGLHHNAYRCRDTDETRAFYEDFLGLPLIYTLRIEPGEIGLESGIGALHSFFRLDDGSCLTFFEVSGSPFEFKKQRDIDLHIALEVTPEVQERMLAKAKAEGRDVLGPVDHVFIHSIYFHDPNGYMIELAARVPGKDGALALEKDRVPGILKEWRAAKAAASA